MKIVLLENVKKLGKEGDIVEVSDGYARNMLIPKKVGVEATKENLNNLKLRLKNEEKKDENLRNIALTNKEVLEKQVFVSKIKAGANGKVFGSVTSKEIAEQINESKVITTQIDKKDIDLDEPFKNIGEYNVDIKLYRDIVVTIKLKIEEE